MADELGEATRALIRAIDGRAIRTVGLKGFPDFIVAFKAYPKIPVFTELKHDNTHLSILQAKTLDDLHHAGLVSILLNYRADKRWAVYRPPFLNKRLQLRSLRNPDAVVDQLSGRELIGEGEQGDE